MPRWTTVFYIGVIAAIGSVSACTKTPDAVPREGKNVDGSTLGKPLPGLSSGELRRFQEGKLLFQKEFSPEEGLGPLFNGRSCWECHGKPKAAGTESLLMAVSSVRKIGKLRPSSPFARKDRTEAVQGVYGIDIDPLEYRGGQALAVRSITREFAQRYGRFRVSPAKVPVDADFVSLRHAPPLLGLGLIGAVPDSDLKQVQDEEKARAGQARGRFVPYPNPFERESSGGRFGWKGFMPSISMFTLDALYNEMGITTPVHPIAKSSGLPGHFPHRLLEMLPKDPNDSGAIALKLSFFVSLLAPPPRGEINQQVLSGEKVFNRLGCAECHRPEYHTASKVWLLDPDCDPKKLAWHLTEFRNQAGAKTAGDEDYIEVKALESQPVRCYSDLLTHKMGLTLADGIPEGGGGGDYWRTTPLWGLRFKKFYLHDGRTTKLTDAIEAHGGQAKDSALAFRSLSNGDRDALIAFLRSL